jgi:hypothetical protein
MPTTMRMTIEIQASINLSGKLSYVLTTPEGQQRLPNSSLDRQQSRSI